MGIKLPSILNIPPKLLPLLTKLGEYRFFLAEGGRGCVDGDTLIDTPNGKVKIKDFQGGLVYSFDGKKRITTVACKPIKYTKEKLYRVSTDTASILVTDEHKFLTPTGWKMLSELSGEPLYVHSLHECDVNRPQSSSELSPSMLHEDVQHCLRIVLGWLYRCWQDYRLCDEQLLSEVKTYQDVLPLLVDVEPHKIHVFDQQGGLDTSYICDQMSQFYSHLYNLVFPQDEEGKSYVNEEICTDERFSELLWESSRLLQQFHEKNNPLLLAQEFSKQLQALLQCLNREQTLQIVFDTLRCDVDDMSYSNSIVNVCNHNHLNTEYKEVNIEFEKVDYYYDMFVPFYNNYLSNGIVNHNSAKTQSVARIVLYLCCQRKMRVVCGRETQSTIDESVYKVLADLIDEYELDFTVLKNTIKHNTTGSEIIFKGFREQGRSNIKGMEGVDLLWIDESEAITKNTLDVVIPTVRKPNSKIIFTMNRLVRDDPVYMFCTERENSLNIHIDYFENPFCPKELIAEAEACKASNEEEYNHIWLGQPLNNATDFLFDSSKVSEMAKIIPDDEGFVPMKVIGIDFAAKGGDLCAASVLERVSLTQWKLLKLESWGNAEPTHSIGRIVNIMGEWKPDKAVLDVGGMGTVVHSRLTELGIKIDRFDGASKVGVPNEYLNARAYGYYTLKNYIDNHKIIMNNKDIERELLQIRYDYRSDGTRCILSKEKMRAKGIHSPDRADSLMMAVWAIQNANLGGATRVLQKVVQNRWSVKDRNVKWKHR